MKVPTSIGDGVLIGGGCSQGFTREIKTNGQTPPFHGKGARCGAAAIAPPLSADNPGPMTKHGLFSRLSRHAPEQAPKKLMDFFDKGLLQHFDFERFPVVRTIPLERKALGARR
jgi:hypothetical protein